MRRGEPPLYRNEFDRATGETVRIEARCFWPRAEAIWDAARYYPLFDANDEPVPDRFACDEADMPMGHEAYFALWSAWYNAHFEGQLGARWAGRRVHEHGRFRQLTISTKIAGAPARSCTRTHSQVPQAHWSRLLQRRWSY